MTEQETIAQQAFAEADQRFSAALRRLDQTNAAVEAAETAYLANQTDENFKTVEDARRTHSRAELDKAAAMSNLTDKRLRSWQAKQDAIEARVKQELELDKTFAEVSQPELARLGVLLAEYWEIAERINKRSIKAREGVLRANVILRDEEFLHRKAHPDYVDPATVELPPGVHHATIDGKPPRPTPRSYPVSHELDGGAAPYVKRGVSSALNAIGVGPQQQYQLKNFLP